MTKSYAIDTNVLLEDPNCIEILRNGVENKIFISENTILELDGLKKDKNLKKLVSKAVDAIERNKNYITILSSKTRNEFRDKFIDTLILDDIKRDKSMEDMILVSNDKIMRLRAEQLNIKSEEFKSSKPYKEEDEIYNGFINIETENFKPNCFFWKEGKLHFNGPKGEKILDYNHEVWKIKPKDYYQNAALELILNNDIPLVSIQGCAGLGKTFLSLAGALQLVLEHKKYNKIYIAKATIEVESESLGYLPGIYESKIMPYFDYLNSLLLKLHEIRRCDRIFNDPDNPENGFNKKKFEIIPLQFLRGKNIEDAIVIIDEVQNLSRMKTRTILTRMGENCKVICCGDIYQIDDLHLDKFNNGMTWINKILTGDPRYAHITLNGKHSRGIITDLILEKGL